MENTLRRGKVGQGLPVSTAITCRGKDCWPYDLHQKEKNVAFFVVCYSAFKWRLCHLYQLTFLALQVVKGVAIGITQSFQFFGLQALFPNVHVDMLGPDYHKGNQLVSKGFTSEVEEWTWDK